MNILFAAVAGVALWYFLSGTVTVENLTDVMKKVTVDGRAYLVTRLGGGVFSVTRADSPTNTVVFDQNSEKTAVGSPQILSQMRTDANRFPSDLFQNS